LNRDQSTRDRPSLTWIMVQSNKTTLYCRIKTSKKCAKWPAFIVFRSRRQRKNLHKLFAQFATVRKILCSQFLKELCGAFVPIAKKYRLIRNFLILQKNKAKPYVFYQEIKFSDFPNLKWQKSKIAQNHGYAIDSASLSSTSDQDFCLIEIFVLIG
jgi:hypothetical protein